MSAAVQLRDVQFPVFHSMAPLDSEISLRNAEKTRIKNLGFFGDCAPKKWPFGQIGPRAVSEKARSAFSRQPLASDQHSALNRRTR